MAQNQPISPRAPGQERAAGEQSYPGQDTPRDIFRQNGEASWTRREAQDTNLFYIINDTDKTPTAETYSRLETTSIVDWFYLLIGHREIRSRESDTSQELGARCHSEILSKLE